MTHRRLWASAVACLLCWSTTSFAIPAAWEKQDVDLRLSGTRQIKAIYHPATAAPRMMKDDKEPLRHQKKLLYPLSQQSLTTTGQLSLVSVNIIDSPPIDGFVPWVAVNVTNANAHDDLDWAAYPEAAIIGSYLTPLLQNNYAIGIFDTGASTTLMGYAESVKTGIYAANLVTTSTVTLNGATGSITALVSYPLGIFIDGLDAIEPNGFLQRTSGMKGESNVAIVVGKQPAPGAPDLPTAIGAPLAVFHSAAFDNGHKVSRTPVTTEYRGPSISLYEPGDPAIPAFNDSSIPLQIRPATGVSVSYFGTFDYGEYDFYPGSPSIITDGFTQSLFFVASVDLADASHTAIDRSKFMLDTGAQVTVIGSTVAARLALNPANPDFQVEITDVTGATTLKPGFYLDSLEIPALGEWFSATHVPVVLMDIDSPEGGYLDGIIGMNLFTQFNMVLKGGAFIDPPALDFKLITNIGDISPAGGDGKVNGLDLAALVAAWLATSGSANWNASADIAPDGGDGIINFEDLAALAANWGWVRGQ